MRNFLKNQKGQGMVEYGLIIGLIAIVLVGVLTALSGGLEQVFTNITNALTGVTN